MKHAKKGARDKDRLLTVALVCVFFLGLGILLYPSVSNWWNEQTQTKAVATYEAAVEDLSEEARAEMLAAAQEYNERLAEAGSAGTIGNEAFAGEDYEALLDVSGTGVMGYVTIDKIGVRLPIYHGTDEGVLAAGAGHLEGTSLPVGGASTHCVISAHRGLPSANLFTNLNKLEEGDTFTLTVLGETLTYKVDQITIVLPTEKENLYIEDGQDYCTLMTCTPYGINSHRLLVRGVRTENAGRMNVDAEAYQVNTLLVAAVAAVPLLLALAAWLFARTRRNGGMKGGTS